MEFFCKIEDMIQCIWEEPMLSGFVNKQLDVSKYIEIGGIIPDDFVVIEEVFVKEELAGIWDEYEPYMAEYNIFPFLGTLGEAVFCIGYGDVNKGEVFYFDFDFGCVGLDGDDLDAFFNKLVCV